MLWSLAGTFVLVHSVELLQLQSQLTRSPRADTFIHRKIEPNRAFMRQILQYDKSELPLCISLQLKESLTIANGSSTIKYCNSGVQRERSHRACAGSGVVVCSGAGLGCRGAGRRRRLNR